MRQQKQFSETVLDVGRQRRTTMKERRHSSFKKVAWLRLLMLFIAFMSLTPQAHAQYPECMFNKSINRFEYNKVGGYYEVRVHIAYGRTWPVVPNRLYTDYLEACTFYIGTHPIFDIRSGYQDIKASLSTGYYPFSISRNTIFAFDVGTLQVSPDDAGSNYQTFSSSVQLNAKKDANDMFTLRVRLFPSPKFYALNSNTIDGKHQGTYVERNSIQGYLSSGSYYMSSSARINKYTPTMSALTVDRETGKTSYTVNVPELSNDEYATGTITRQDKLPGGSWFDSESAYTVSKNKTNYTQNEFLTEINKRKLTLQEYANGTYIRLKACIKPNSVVPDDPFFETYSTEEYFTGRCALIKDRKLNITQNNRDVTVSWESLQPAGNPVDQDKSPFEIQKWNGSSWDILGEVSFDYQKKNYAYTYTLKDTECNKGMVGYKFRVWRKKHANVNALKEYFCSDETTFNVNTNYKTLRITGINPVTGSTSATINWTFNETGGIWDKNANISVQIDGMTPQSATYDATSYTIGGLQGCKRYSAKLVVTVSGKSHQTTAGYSFLMPNINKRTIKNFEASKGYYSDYVLLSWEVPANESDFEYFNITRTPISGGNETHVAQITHSGLSRYNYQDKNMDAGIIYNYKIEGFSMCDGNYTSGGMMTDAGLCQPYASVSGRIAYEGSTAVNGVTVSIQGNEDAARNKSLLLNHKETTATVEFLEEVSDFKKNKKQTYQMWLCPNKEMTWATIMTKGSQLVFGLKTVGEQKNVLFIYFGGKMDEIDFLKENITLPKDAWTHLTLTLDYNGGTEGTIGVYINGELKTTVNLTGLDPDTMSYGSTTDMGTMKSESSFSGNIDEIRFWNTILSKETIKNNYGSYISGKESGLMGYYRCDEEGARSLFDISAMGSTYNKRNARLGTMAQHSANVPSGEQLSNKTITDADGNYLINTVPFTSDGLQYNIVPSLGIHKFTPSKQPIFASTSSRVFNAMNFKDDSSFPVSGYIYYEGTNYPVEGASIEVDGIPCSSEGQMILTDANGYFNVSVAIGAHHIEVKKNGHTFVSNGRFPVDPNKVGLKHTFEKELDNPLYFWDNTKVVLAGRVTGGEVETGKALGLGLSKANIGRAKIVLEATKMLNTVFNNSTFAFDDNTVAMNLATATEATKSRASIGFGAANSKKIVVLTDSLTGEFSVKVPPIALNIAEMSIPANANITLKSNITNLNLSDATVVKTDSAKIFNGKDSVLAKFSYHEKLQIDYRVPSPTVSIEDVNNKDGMFGEKEYEYIDPATMAKEKLQIYNEQGKYNYKYPVLLQNGRYKIKVKAFEVYENRDNAAAIVYDQVPMPNRKVELTANFAATTGVYLQSGTVQGGENSGKVVTEGQAMPKTDEMVLDEKGEVILEVAAGFPNIVAPYTWGMNLKVENNGSWVNWDENETFQTYVLGELPTGSNFVTSGPDKVLMVLRDPPGTKSSAYMEKGVKTVHTETDGGSVISSNEINTVTSLGFSLTTISGTPFFGVITEAKTVADLEVGVEINASYSGSKTWENSVTTTERIGTSGDSNYVGADGDVFVGVATNILFGNARAIRFEKSPEGVFSVGRKDVLTTGSEFKTAFKYDQYYIENTLIGNLKKLRNDMLKTVSQADYNNSEYLNNTEEPIFITALAADDERFGSDNFDTDIWGGEAVSKNMTKGPSYRMVIPSGLTAEQTKGKVFEDKIRWYNSQLALWKETLAENEKAKVTAIKNREKWLDKNHSLSSGVEFESSVETCEAEKSTHEREFETLAVIGFGTEVDIMGSGVALSAKTTTGGKYFGSTESGTETCTKTGYTIAEEGDDDALSVDVFKAPDGFGAIFSTRGGQTSCPYEPERKTKYFEPGNHTLSAATMQIEIPRITAENTSVADVPSGTAANFKLKLDNLSEIDENVWFKLVVADGSNPNGAKITVDGQSIVDGNGRLMLVKAGETLQKNLQITQTRVDELDYENIKIVLASQCQSDETGIHKVIADTLSLSAYFVPSCSPIKLQIDNRMVNTQTGNTLKAIIRDYDRNYQSLKAIRFQYKAERDLNWKTLKEYVTSADDVTSSNELLTENRINISLDMNNASYIDQNYLFRAVTVCSIGSTEEMNESETITVIKDMAIPSYLGLPSPINGILTPDSEIFVNFNEAIKPGALTAGYNFSVTGALNARKVNHDVAFDLQNSTPATTEASVNLDKTDFTVEMWINYAGNGGSIFSHGTGVNKFKLDATADNKLAVTVGDKTYTSVKALETNKWIYLAVAYDYSTTGNVVNAKFASDASTVDLFVGQPVADYTGVGGLALGKNLTAKIHEVTLWNKARLFAQSQSEMYTTKYATTPNLIGYWPLDEGEGKNAQDKARRRHFTLPNATWAFGVENKAVTVNNGYVSLNTSKLSVKASDNYVVEMWFRGNNKAKSTLFGLRDKLVLGFNPAGVMTLKTGNLLNEVSKKEYLDNAWHHVALNVLRNGNTTVYVDGEAQLQMISDSVPALAGAALDLGALRSTVGMQESTFSDFFNGSIDEVRIWNATLTGDVIRLNMHNRLSGKEPGLVAYYPFEEKGLDESNQPIVTTTLKDKFISEIPEITPAQDPVTLGNSFTNEATGLKDVREESSVKFGFTASDTKVVINVAEEAARIEDCTLKFTVKGVPDLNGNYCSPIVWTAYVNRNQLIWNEDELSLTKELMEEKTFTATITNNSGLSERWTLTNLPSWLSVNKQQGSLKPLSSETLTFSVVGGTPIGKYETSIYLSGNNYIDEALVVSLAVTADKPDWSVNPKEFEQSMNIIGVAKVENKLMQNTEDIIAAFVGDKCVGIASPKYYSIYDSYFVMMDIYGNDAFSQKTVTFKIWESATGRIYPTVITSNPVAFEDGILVGTVKLPLELNANNNIEQHIAMGTGWNWMSLNVKNSNMDINNVFANIMPSIDLVKSKLAFASNTGSKLVGDLETMSNLSMYKVKATEKTILNFAGSMINAQDAENAINLVKGWSWISYTPQSLMPIADALADVEVEEGDLIKAQNGFALYTNNTWVGSLEYLTPGQGYMYKTETARSFKYPQTYKTYNLRMLRSMNTLSSSTQFIPDHNSYPNNMTMIAKVVSDNGVEMTDVEVGVFAGDVCRGAAKSKEDGFLYLTISGNIERDKLEFRVYNQQTGEITSIDQGLYYGNDQNVGSDKAPYEIKMKTTSGLDSQFSGISIYPTKVVNKLYIKSSVALHNVKVTDVDGKMLIFRSITPVDTEVNTEEIDLTNFEDGMYIVTVETVQGERVVQKIVK